MVGERIWEHLSLATPERHSSSVELFFQLHQLTPTPWLCEDIIGSKMTQHDQVPVLAQHKTLIASSFNQSGFCFRLSE